MLPAAEVAGDLEARKPLLMAALGRLTEDVTVVHDDSIAALTENGAEVRVDFERGVSQTFDLVVGADGVHSRVRTLTLDPDRAGVRHLGLVGAGFTVADAFDLDRTGVLWQDTGRAAYVVDAGEQGRRTVSLSFASATHTLDRAARAEQESVVRRAFAGAGWRVPELLDAMGAAEDLYVASGAQVVLDRWSSGRIVLVGDAAGCAAPTSGMGTSQALLGASALAARLSDQPDHHAACTAYEAELRPVVERNQELGRVGAQRFGAT